MQIRFWIFNQGGGSYYAAEGDQLWVTKDTGVTSFAQVKIAVSTDYANSSVVTLGSGGHVTLVGVARVTGRLSASALRELNNRKYYNN